MKRFKNALVWMFLFTGTILWTILIAMSFAWMMQDEPDEEVIERAIERLEEQRVEEDTTSLEVVSLKTQTEPTWDDFIEAVIYVESRGSDDAYNIKEQAAGCLQIRPIMVREINRKLSKWNAPFRYTLDDRWNREKSIEMFNIMAEQVPCCEDQEFMEFAEVVARKWNGGGRGHLKESTLPYWNRIKDKINLDSQIN
ncbi:MAG: hypothetical protein ACPG45_09095 [Flavobacteriaceae bacterium]